MAVRIVLHPGPHDRREVPISIPAPAGLADGAVTLNPGGIPGQVAVGRLCFLADRMNAGKSLALTARQGKTPPALAVANDDDMLTFTEGGELVTRYHFGPRSALPLPARPYFHPVNLGNLGLTRHVASKSEPAPKIDHTHHRSLWVAHGDVNGSDNWSEEAGHGFQRHVAFPWIAFAGPVWVGFEEKLEWESAQGKKLLEETRIVRLWRSIRAGRFLDLDVTFRAAFGDIRLGDTKEGGICAVRVREPLQGDRTGLLTNAWGGVGEADVWGQRSPWIDYSGTLEKKKVGIAILDHPASFRYPTHWHARDYGLCTANPFAWHDYGTGWSQDGSHTISKGGSITFRYRVYLHAGDCRSARVAAHWLDFAHPPKQQA